MIDSEYDNDVGQDIAEDDSLGRELSFLFGEEIVEQARLIDIADLNLSDEMTTEIGKGIRQLKQLQHDAAAQRQWVSEQTPALRLLLCLWIMDMELLDKIQTRSYLDKC